MIRVLLVFGLNQARCSLLYIACNLHYLQMVEFILPVGAVLVTPHGIMGFDISLYILRLQLIICFTRRPYILPYQEQSEID